MINRFAAVFIGIIIIAVGVASAAALFTQSVDAETGAVTPGILPIALPTELFGFPIIIFSAVIALIGLGVIFFGWQFGY